VRRLLAKIDVPVRQEMIEARIVEAADNFSKSLGARLGYTDFRFFRNGIGGSNIGKDGPRIQFSGNREGIGLFTGQAEDKGTGYIPDSFMTNLPASGLRGFSAGQFAFSLFSNSMTRFINVELSALEADGKGKIISSPRVLTADNVEATIEQGTEIPYQTATSSGATALSFRKANLALKVKPQITPDGNIIMTLDVNKDQPGATTPAGVQIATKHVKTEVLVENGGTVVIGGIYEQNDRNDITKVPFFGDIPVLGFFFRNNTTQTNKTELLIFITPRIVNERLTIR
jgi:type IV pilus assembly protein PilQ